MSGKDGKAKHCWMLSKTFEYKNFVDNAQQCFPYTPQANFPANDLDFHWRWMWWDQNQATFLNLLYFMNGRGLGTYKKQGLRQRLFLSSNHTAVFLTYSKVLSQVGTYKSSHASCQNAYHPGGNGLLSPLFVKSQCHHRSAMHWCLLPFHRKTRWTRISWPHLSSPVKRQFSHGTKSWKKDYFIESNVLYRSNV